MGVNGNRRVPPAEPGPAVVHFVDDDLALLRAVKFDLETEGFEVHTYASAAELLGNKSELRGCLVVDYVMRDVDGLALLDGLRKAGIDLPAILITTNPSAQFSREAALRSIPIVEKPLLTSALSDAIRQALRPG